jgi:GNAT superfamily N-acetyltransferase
MSIKIRTVESRKDLMQFIKFPWKIYKNFQYWVPPLIMDRKKMFDKKKNPFYKHSEVQLFLAEKNGEITGRIAAIKNDLHNIHHNDNTGFFGFFESINDQQAANALFDSVKEWLKKRGLTSMRGPANPSSNDEYGMLIDGFDDYPRLLMPYNPKYYLDLCENYGLKKAKDLYAYKIEHDKMMTSDKLKRVAEISRQRYKVNITQLNMKKFNSELEKVKYVYNKAWEPNWGFVPMTNEEIDAMAKDLKPIVEPSIVLFAEIDSKTVAFALVMPDYNFIFKKLNGKLFPFGFIRLMTEKKKIKWARIIALGVIPEFQRKGIDSVLYWEIVNRSDILGIHLGEASWVLEDNEMMKRGLDVMNAHVYKKYRMYEIKI